MNLAQTLEALNEAIASERIFASSSETEWRSRDLALIRVEALQSLRDALPQMAADAESKEKWRALALKYDAARMELRADAEAYRKMIAAGPVAFVDEHAIRRIMWIGAFPHKVGTCLYALSDTKEGGQ